MQMTPSLVRTRLVSLCALTSLAILPACARQTLSSAKGTDVFCKAASPIYWSKKDTDKTLAQIKEHNAVGATLCGWGKK